MVNSTGCELHLILPSHNAYVLRGQDHYWSAPLEDRCIKLPNKGYSYQLSPLAYVTQHGWPALCWVLCHLQAHAVNQERILVDSNR